MRERGREKEINIYGGRHRQKNREIQTVWWFLTQTPYEGRKRYLYSLFLQNQNERCMLFKDAILTYIKRSLQCCHPVGDGQSEGRHSHLRHTGASCKLGAVQFLKLPAGKISRQGDLGPGLG